MSRKIQTSSTSQSKLELLVGWKKRSRNHLLLGVGEMPAFSRLRSIGYPLLVTMALCVGQLGAEALKTNASEWNPALYQSLTHANFEGFEPFSDVIDFKNVDYPLLHAALNFETNRVRVLNRLEPLKWHVGLETAAYHHAKAMAEHDFFSHTSPLPGRKSPEERAKLAGIQNPKIAENIAISFGIEYKARSRVFFLGKGHFSYDNRTLIPNRTYLSLAKAIVGQWMKSPGHRANILSKNGIAMGNGVHFFIDRKFNDMVKCAATQKFQWFQEVEWKKGRDPYPPKWAAVEETEKAEDPAN